MKSTTFTDVNSYINHWEKLKFIYSFDSSDNQTYTRLHELDSFLMTYSKNPISNGVFYDNHLSSAYYLLRFLLSGEEIFYCENKKIILEASDCLISHPTQHGTYERRESSVGINVLIPKHTFQTMLCTFSQYGRKLSCLNGINKVMFDYTVSIERQLPLMSEDERQLITKNYLNLICQWLNQLVPENTDTFSNIIQVIDDHLLYHEFNLNQLSYLVGKSTRTIQLILNEHGMTFSKYLVDKRLMGACQDLVGSDLKITDIANKWNFYDNAHFDNAFYGNYGCTPSQYRKKYQKVIGRNCWLKKENQQ